MNDAGVSLLFQGCFEHLQELDLRYNSMGAEGAKAIAKLDCPVLEDLYLCGNQIGDEGAKALAKAGSLPELSGLHLAGNQLGTEGIRALLTSPSHDIAYFDFEDNRPDPNDIESLRELAEERGCDAVF